MLTENTVENIPKDLLDKNTESFVPLNHLSMLWKFSETPQKRQSLTFYRKLRKFFILSELSVDLSTSGSNLNELELSQLANTLPFLQRCHSAQLSPSDSSKISILNEYPMRTLSDYCNFLKDEKKRCLQDLELYSILATMSNIYDSLSGLVRGLAITPYDIIISENGELKLIDSVLYSTVKKNHENNTEFDKLRFLCKFSAQITHSDYLKGTMNPTEYLEAIKDSFPATFKFLTGIDIEDSAMSNSFAGNFLENKKQFLIYIYTRIVDLIPLEDTMKDHFAISDQLNIDPNLLQEFWNYYLNPQNSLLVQGNRRYRYGRWRSLFYSDRQAKGEYTAALELLQEYYGDSPSLEIAAIYDGLACVAFSEGAYDTSRDYLKQALEIIQKVNGLHSSVEAIIHSNMTHVLSRLGLKEEAKQCTNRAIEITLKHHSEDNIFFTVLHGNFIILTSSDEEKCAWLRKSVNLKKVYWGPEHPNVHLTIHNFFSLAKRAFETEFPYPDQVLFDMARLDSHIKYYGELHSSAVEIARSICYKLHFGRRDHDLLRFFSRIRKSYKFASIFPLEEEFKGKMLKRVSNPLGIQLTKSVYTKEVKLKKSNVNSSICQTWILGIEYPYWSSQRELEKNIIHPCEKLY